MKVMRMPILQILIMFCFALKLNAAVAPQNLCINCHQFQPPKLSNPVKLWKTSIHAEHNIACNSCHGGDPLDAANSMSKAKGFRGVPFFDTTPAICGGCHMSVVKHYMNSAHGRALGRGGPTCVTCHGSHAIQNASLDIINKDNCTQCHGFEKALMIRDVMIKTDRMLKSIDDKIKLLKSQGVETDALAKKLFSLRNRLHTMFHTLDVNRIREESVQIQAELEKSSGSGGVGTDLGTAVLAISWAISAAVLFYLIKKNLT